MMGHFNRRTLFSVGSGNSNPLFNFFPVNIHATNQNYFQPAKNALLCQKVGLRLKLSQGGLQKSLRLNIQKMWLLQKQ